MESALIISPSNRSASSIASADFPDAVGPAIMTTFILLEVSPLSFTFTNPFIYTFRIDGIRKQLFLRNHTYIPDFQTALVRVIIVISGGQLNRTGSPTTPIPLETYTCQIGRASCR